MPDTTQPSDPNPQVELRHPRNILILLFVGVFLAEQIIVPISRLAAERPARFGWQMWSGRRPSVRFVAVMQDGTRQLVNTAPYVAQRRGELELSETLPVHLCRVMPGVRAVEVTPAFPETPHTYTCP